MKRTCLALATTLWSAPVLAACPVGETPLLHVRIYFGQTDENAKPIPAATWEDFVATTVTPLFPEGFTIYAANGQWRDLKTRMIGREASKIIEVDRRDTRDLHAKIAQIRKTYQGRFHQQAVGLVTLPACGSF